MSAFCQKLEKISEETIVSKGKNYTFAIFSKGSVLTLNKPQKKCLFKK